MKLFALLGRILFGLIFVMALPNHFKANTIEQAANHGVPMANVLVPLAGIIAFVGGVSVILGWKARWGAALLILFLVPVTLVMHNFWTMHDPGLVQMQMINFMKNAALLGGAFFMVYFGAGPLSIDEHAPSPVRRDARERAASPAPVL